VSILRRVREVVAVVVAWARGRSRRTWVVAAVGLLLAAGVPAVLVAARGPQPALVRLPRPVAGGRLSDSAVGTRPSASVAPVASSPTASKPAAQPSSTSGTADFRHSTVVVSLRDPAATAPITTRGGTVVKDITGTGFLRVTTAGDPSALVAQLQADPAVVAASLDYGRKTSAVPNDPLYGSNQQTYMSTIRMPEAWDRLTDASSQVVAVVDTGVDTTHPDLAGRTVAGYNVVAPGSAPTDTVGHGTFVAGEIAADANNGIGTAGVIWNGRVMPVRVFADNSTSAYDSDIATGIVWAVDHGARVINLSLGGPANDPLLHAAVQYAVNRDVVVVAVAGNTGDNTAQYPAAFPEVIAVGATDPAGNLTDFSTYGNWISVAAPGFNITSTYPGNQYAIGAGTSFAAPIVSGIAALVRAQNPALTEAQVGDRLRSSARDAGPRGFDPYYGYGVIDAARALGAPLAADFPLPSLGAGEPNDVPARATPVTLGTPISATFGVEGDVDWYSLNSASAQAVTVTVAPPAYNSASAQNAVPVLDVYNASLGRIAHAISTGAGVPATATVSATGTTYIKVSNYNGAAETVPYGLTVSAVPAFAVTSARLDTQPDRVAIGDLNGDGRPDLIYTTEQSWSGAPASADDNKVFLRAQQPDGTLGAPTLVYSGAVSSLALMDVDQDGRLDVVLGVGTTLSWLRQDTTGHLVFQGTLVDLGATPLYTATGDVNGDGRTDLVVLTASSSNSLDVLLHGTGSSFTVSSIPNAAPMQNPTDIAVGDVNGDGWADVVYATGSSVQVFYNSPSGWSQKTYAGIAPPGSLSLSLEYVAIGDVTGDGRNDIVASSFANEPNSVINVFKQNTDGTLAAPTMYDAGDLSQDVELGDVDGDGRTDVVVSNHSADVHVLTQRADGTLNTAVSVPVPYSQSFGGMTVAVGDLDGDGIADIVNISDMTLSFVDSAVAATQPDAQALVQTVTPVEYSTGAALATAPQVVFATDVVASTVNGSTVALVDGRTGLPVPASVSYDSVSRTATITPTNPLRRATPYRIVINGVTAFSGLPSPVFASTFSTTSTGPLGTWQNFSVSGQLGTAASVSGVVPIGDLADVIVRYAAGSTPPVSLTDGTAGYQGPNGGVSVGGLTPGQTYSFAAWYRDQNGNLSPAGTATLIGTTVTAAAATPVDGAGVSRLAFTGTLGVQGGSTSGVAVPLVAYCAGGVAFRFPVATATADGSGAISVTVVAGDAHCSYRWEITDSTQYMGVVTALVRADGGGVNPPPGQTPLPTGH
jgi:type VII secretion-associated serine protease mycosin